jgi:glycosyltransferase involved in cell wall biosynthesis
MQQALFMPLLTRMPKQKVKAQVVSLAPGFSSGMVLRQSGIPVYDIPLSKQRFAFGALGELLNIARQFRPDVIQAWGHTAQLAAMYVRKRCDWKPKVVWSVADTAPIAKDAGLIDRRKLKMTATRSAKADRIVYTSEAAAAQHRRCGYPDSGHAVIPAGIDPTRFKPDYEARRKVRDQLGLAADAFVIGMAAPFQPEYDHATLLKGVGELIKTHPHVSVILAGHGVQKGNAPLMALVGGGTLGTRAHLLGEWSDTASFFAACDVACSSALNDGSRMTLVMAMLCGIPCVATGIGAQGEMLGRFGVAIEAGSPAAVVRGITRVMQMPEDRRIAMVQSARKYALANFVSVLSMQKYLQLYYDVVGRQALADVPAPQVDAAIPAPPADLRTSSAKKERTRAAAAALVSLHQVSDPDSLEEQVPEVAGAYKAPPPPLPAPVVPREEKSVSDGDVLKIFESGITRAKSNTEGSPMSERARGVAEDLGDLLSPEELQTSKVEAVKPVEAKAPKPPKPAASTPAPTNPVAAKSVAPEAVRVAPVVAPTSATQPMAAAVAEPVRVAPPPAPAPELKTVSLVPAVRDTPVQLPMLLEEELFAAAPETASVEPTLQLRLLDDGEQPPLAAAG